MPNIIIGLTGLFGSGCRTAANYFIQRGFKAFSLTDRIREECKSRGIQNPQRHDLQNIGDELRNKNGENYLAREIIRQIRINDKKVIIKSIRNNHEVLFLQNKYKYFYLVNINAPIETRYKRAKKAGDYTSRDDFDRDDARDAGNGQPGFGQQVNKCSELADIIINNSTTKREFFRKLDLYLKLMLHPGYYAPSDMEINMAQAYFWSLRSQCLRRKVGAIIVRNGHVVASGFNDVPRRIIIKNNNQIEIAPKSCKLLGKCYRKTFSRCLNCESIITLTSDNCEKCHQPVPKEQKSALNKHLDLCRAIHAEERAILQVAKLGGQSLDNGILYTTTFPCQLCAKKIIEVGISEVVYVWPYPYPEASKLLNEARISLTTFEGAKSRAFDKLYGLSI